MKKLYYMAIGLTIMFTSCGDGDKEYDASGVFEATEVIVSARATGEVSSLNITEGDELKAGEAIGCIDTTQLHWKRVQLISNMKAVDSRVYDISRQISVINQQISTQQSELTRFKRLVKANAANQKQVDDIESQIAILKKQLDVQKENLQNSNNSINSESKGISAQVAQLDDQIMKSIIVSPINGTVLAKYAQQGEMANMGRALFKAADVKHLFLRAYITAGQLTDIKLGEEVKVYADKGDKDRKEYNGKIAWISDKAEFTPKTIQTRDERANLVYAIKIAVENDGYIKCGMYGDVKFYKK